MVIIGDDSPRWLRELARFLPLKSLLFIHGNVLDLVSFPVRRPDTGKVYWTDDDLPNFLVRFLSGMGYQVVGLIDPVDGLTFPNREMEGLYAGLRRGKSPDATAASGNRRAMSASSAPGGYEAIPDGRMAGAPGLPEQRNSAPSKSATGKPAESPATAVDFNSVFNGIRSVVKNSEVPCVFVFHMASRLVTSPGHVSRDERALLTRVLKASLECADVFTPDGAHFKNSLILICDKLNDLPPFLFVNNPKVRSIHVDKPDSRDRARFIQRTYPAFFGAEGSRPSPELVPRFAALTEGLSNYELMSLVTLSRRESIEIKSIENICQRYKYGVTESEWDKLDRARLSGAEAHLRSRVKGQDEAIARVLDIIKRARIGLAAGQQLGGSRPRGVLFFAGPTGVGKTEMAKSLAELIFGQEDRCIRFDMSEYSAPQSDERLLGAPPGYVGYEEGGQLTNALKERPFSILLFDEVEKAHGRIFDKFLQVLDDGRITDGKGETVYFSESVIIFTSNLGTVARGDDGSRRMLVSPDMPFGEMKEMILESIRDHFNYVLGRPEILNRFGDNFVVFNFIRPPVDEEIVDLLLLRLAHSIRAKWKIDLQLEPAVRRTLIGLARGHLHHGGRGIRNIVDAALVNPLARFLFDYDDRLSDGGFIGEAAVRIVTLKDHGQNTPYRFEVLGEVARQ